MICIDDAGRGSAQAHMERDRVLLTTSSTPCLHFYEWDKKSITYGHFLDPWQLVNREHCQELGFAVARRPTGGGLLFHYDDFSFSLFVPATCPHLSARVLDNYASINGCVVRALDEVFSWHRGALAPVTTEARPTFCMAALTQYDVTVDGYKIGGAAQRRTRAGLLHQTSLFLTEPNWHEIALVTSAETVRAMQSQSRFLLSAPQNVRKKLKEHIIAAVTKWLSL